MESITSTHRPRYAVNRLAYGIEAFNLSILT
jgi:hypothetical protein